MANENATTGTDTFVFINPGDDTITITAPDQIQEDDLFDGGTGNNTLICSTPTNNSLNFFTVTNDANHGFHNFNAINFVNNAAFTAVIVNASQFGAGLISMSSAVTGIDGYGATLSIFGASNFDASGFTFSNWQHTSDIFTDHKLSIGGTTGNDTLTGNDTTSNELAGLEGNDTLNGAALDDVIDGGLGQDTMTGHAGADTFSFESTKESHKGAATRDVITDFSGDNGENDTIDLSFIDAKKGVPHNQAFHFIGAHRFHHKLGELQVKYDAINHIGIVSGDVNGDGKADFQIEVHSLTALVVGDFVL